MDQTVKLWSVPEGKRVKTLAGHKDDVNGVAFTPDGAMLVSGSEDETPKIWSVAEERELTTAKGDNKDNVQCVRVSPDGKLAASCGNKDKKIRLWSLPSGAQLPSLEGHRKTVTCLAFSPDGRTLASGGDDQTVILWTRGDSAK